MRRTGFARSKRGLVYALAQDATGKSLSELLEMDEFEVYAIAKLRERYYDELHSDTAGRR